MPRLMGNGNRSEWWHQHLPAGKGISPEASLSLYKQSQSQSHPFGLSQSPSTTNGAAPSVQMQYHALPLSMGFEAVREELTAGKKPVKYWRLTEEAVTNSMQSTTRYRKQMNYKKSVASDPPAPVSAVRS
ncbi:hypothetical protein BJX76DRAFT_358590 [Aspergillus varians]